ncbi:MAG: hypothetical protein EA377_08935 [Phycisphaerales bacterium]|nr:MAG: hypothetical protein EA377_08935 [Phycisphaerales bacterium]
MMIRRGIQSASLVAGVIALSATVAAVNAETVHDVQVGPGFSFTPAQITIEAGDTVRWTWAGGEHNVVSGVDGNPDGNFSSGPPVDAPGLTFEVTFDQQFLDDNPMPDNIYPYYCEPHLIFGMVGDVTVEVPDITPCPEDLTDSGVVNVFDLLALLDAWGPCTDPDDCPADLTGEGVVNVFDLLALLDAWGACPD